MHLVTTDSGENEAIWGDGAKGKWTIDVPSQFFSISKESFGGWLGKKIWAGTIEDFYYLEGTVRGWGPISPASVVGQWQGVRLGVVNGERVTAEERGVAPWFAMDDVIAPSLHQLIHPPPSVKTSQMIHQTPRVTLSEATAWGLSF